MRTTWALGRDGARASDGSLVRKTGVMAVVLRGGVVAPGDALTVVRPAQPWQALAPV